tara:strand:+ start:654 stop:1598 length:945 start_codon:yes stop_codon:yes gene_type:complete
MQLKIKIILSLLLLFIVSCTIQYDKIIFDSSIKNKKDLKSTETKNSKIDNKNIISSDESDKSFPIYYVGESFFIDDVKYFPDENYSYNETGLASFYSKELHRKKTINNEYNLVTDLLARHKTLPIPSVVKITNLENGLSLVVRVNDRDYEDNSRIIHVSRKVAQLLRFYKNKIARVRVQLLTDPSKQLKIVTESMTDPNFDNTIDSAPTETVTISDLEGSIEGETIEERVFDNPIELGFEEVVNNELFVNLFELSSYQEIKNLIDILNIKYKTTTQKENNGYSVLFGPMENKEAKNLIKDLSIKGYTKSKIIIK